MNALSLSRRSFCNGFVIILAGLLASPWAAGADKYWICSGTAWWDTSTCWAYAPGGVGGAGQPLSGDAVFLTQSDAVNRTVNYRTTLVPQPELYELRIDALGSGTMTLSQSTSSLVVEQFEYVGYTGTGSFIQSGGTHTVASFTGNHLSIGQNAGSSGSYYLSGSGSLSVNQNEYVGRGGTGIFIQSGGTHAVTGDLYIGSNSTGNGSYNLSGAGSSLTAGSEFIGHAGIGAFTHSGGTHAVTGNLTLGGLSTGNGNYNLGGSGSLTVGSEIIGHSGSGTFTQSGGTHTINAGLTMGVNNGGAGTYNLNGGVLNIGGDIVNGAGSSTLNLNGGTFNFTGTSMAVDIFRIGQVSGSNGTHALATGKTLTTTSEYIGFSGNGILNQSGGTHTVNSALYLGSNATGQGSYGLSGTGSLTAGSEFIGYSGTGMFTQSGGTHTVNTSLTMGYNSGSAGTYNLNGGTLNVAGAIYDGAGVSTFNLSGGTLNVMGSIAVDYFRIASAAGSNVSFTLATGKTLSTVDTTVGHSGTGILTQGGGTHLISGNLILAANAGSYGTYRLNDGALNIGGNIVDGAGMRSTFNLDGGTLSVSGSSIAVDVFRIGSVGGSSGSFTLASGKSLTTASEDVGYAGNGSMTQDGGTHAISGELNVGNLAGSIGTYHLNSGNLAAPNEYVGRYGTGTFTQSGGTNAVNNYFFVAYNSGSNGTYNLGGTGSLSANSEHIGNYGTGTVNQSGGQNSVATSLYLGYSNGGSGAYNLSGDGSLSASNEYIGYFGVGNFTQSGGTHTVSNNISVGSQSTGNGTYTLNSGAHTVGGTMTLAAYSGSSGTYNLAGGKLRAANIVVNSGGTFNFSGGTLAVDHFTGNLENNGGTLAPGDSPGITNITGDYTQSVSGIFAVEIGGLLAGTEYDVLNVSGTANLDGTLNVSLFDPGGGLFSPKLGDSFDILTAEYLQGSFSSYLFAAIDPGLKWDIAYLIDANGSTDVLRLSVNAVPVPPAVWLFGSGLVGLAAVARRKPSKQK